MIELSLYLVSPSTLDCYLLSYSSLVLQRGIEEEQILLDLEAYGMLLVSTAHFRINLTSFKKALST